MKRKFLSNLLLLILLNLLIKPFWVFGIDRTIQNIIGSTEYGIYFSLFSFSLLLNILLDFGVTNYNNRTISQNPAKISIFFFNIVALKSVLAIIYFLVVFLLASALGFEKRMMNLLILIGLNQFLSSIILYLRSNISGLQFYMTDSILSVLDRMIMIILCSLAIWGNILGRPVQLIDFISIQTVSYSLVIIITLFILIRKAPTMRFQLDFQMTIKIVQDCLPFALLYLLMSIYNRMDSVMLERMLPDGKMHAGIYAQSFRILDAFNMFAFLFPSLLLPMFSKLLKNQEPVASLLGLSIRIIVVCATSVAITCSVFSSQVITHLYHEHTFLSTKVFAILIISFIPVSISYIFGTLLTANGNLKQLNAISFSALCLNWSLNYFLIPRYEALGSAWACLITQSMVATVQVILSYRISTFGFPKPAYGKYLTFFLFSSICVAMVYFLPIPWFVKIVGLSILLVFMGFLSRMLSIKQVLIFVQQQRWDF